MAWNRGPRLAHNHDYSGAFDRKSPDCPACVATAEKSGIAIHTCEHHGAFGRRDLSCARCRQLMEGLEAPTTRAIRHARESEAARLNAIRTHDCRKSNCGPVCTAFEW